MPDSSAAWTSLHVLVVEDDEPARTGLLELLRSWGTAADGAADGDEALALIAQAPPDVVLADLLMPKRDGLELLHGLRDSLHELTFVMMTAHADVESAVAAMKDGAYDYLTKPIEPQRLRAVLDKIAQRHESRRDLASMKRRVQQHGRFGQTVGISPKMREVYELIEQVAPSDASVLIWGESGTGKELVARAIHDRSARAAAPFVAVNCAAIPEGLLESEIFGHERGAFTGAVDRRQGCFELAHAGTLFLDEIAEMVSAVQAKLLRVLQERTVRRLGGKHELPVNVRVIAATNITPQQAIADGRLREDLYYRLNVVSIALPPLRDRSGDIPLLAQTFVTEFAERDGRQVQGLTREALQALEQYPWPGNVRELRNVIERAVILSRGELLTEKELPRDLVYGPPPPARDHEGLAPGMRVEDAERRLIELTLGHTGNNKIRAADMLGISLKTLYNKLQKYKHVAGPASATGA
ncbi:MAG: sigma-54-dependent transcriptional regulator [Vicinamibacterales bacterium]